MNILFILTLLFIYSAWIQETFRTPREEEGLQTPCKVRKLCL